MAISIAIIIIGGLIANTIFRKLNLPGLLGMILFGILIGPFALKLIKPELIAVSKDFRELALIVILLRAGFTINSKTLKQIGFNALKLSFIPAIFEMVGVTILSYFLLKFTLVQSMLLASVLGAVSPAVIVPFMIEFKQKGLGTKKGIPSLILSASSVDDIFVIVIFTSLMGVATGSGINVAMTILSVPISIILGLIVGLIIGLALVFIFKKFHIRDTIKVLIILSLGVILTFVQGLIKKTVPYSALISIMFLAIVLLEKYEKLVGRLSIRFEKIWIPAQILLFVLIGSEVNLKVAFNTGWLGVVVILVGLLFRSTGVLISLIGSNLNKKERLFTVFSYLPKATVQAAIGAVPFSFGVPNGDKILALAVLSILITAPLGAILIKLTAPKLLEQEDLTSQLTQSIKEKIEI